MVLRKELEEWLNAYLLVERVTDLLPNGLQIEGRETIKKLIISVSVNLDIIETAIKENADAILVHHGLFWKSDDARVRGYRKNRMKKILEHDINLFAYHLPLDFHPEISHNLLILKGLGVDAIEEPGDGGAGKKYTIGLKGTFHRSIAFKDLINRINKTLDTEARYFQYGTDRIKTLFVVSGAGRNELDEVIDLGVDAYLTGDAKESTQYLAKEGKLNYIYAGHYKTETPGIIELGKKIEKQFDVRVCFIDIVNPL